MDCIGHTLFWMSKAPKVNGTAELISNSVFHSVLSLLQVLSERWVYIHDSNLSYCSQYGFLMSTSLCCYVLLETTFLLYSQHCCCLTSYLGLTICRRLLCVQIYSSNRYARWLFFHLERQAFVKACFAKLLRFDLMLNKVQKYLVKRAVFLTYGCIAGWLFIACFLMLVTWKARSGFHMLTLTGSYI